jgi:hypothetical protein
MALKMNRPEDENVISIDPDGDRCLIVGTEENQKSFRVSSKAMCLASPVWRAMLTGPYKEATAKEIPFPAAEPGALIIALRIAHLQFRDLPSSLDFQELVNLAALCDEYDMVPIVRPFSTKWIHTLEPLAEKIGFEEWLFVAWTFGCPEIFDRIACRLVLFASTNAYGQCLNEEEKVLEDFMPPGIIGKVRTLSKSFSYFRLTMLKQKAYFVRETPSFLRLSMSVTYISIGSIQARHNVAKPMRTQHGVML